MREKSYKVILSKPQLRLIKQSLRDGRERYEVNAAKYFDDKMHGSKENKQYWYQNVYIKTKQEYDETLNTLYKAEEREKKDIKQ